MTNWRKLTRDSFNVATLKRWATGKESTRGVTSLFKNTVYAGDFRSLVRDHGTMYARRLARKALKRRKVM